MPSLYVQHNETLTSAALWKYTFIQLCCGACWHGKAAVQQHAVWLMAACSSREQLQAAILPEVLLSCN